MTGNLLTKRALVRALDAERARKARVAELRERHERLLAYYDRIVAERDHKAGQIPLTERESRMYENRMALAWKKQDEALSDLLAIAREDEL